MWEVAKHERRKRVAGNNSQTQLSKLPSTTVTLVDECTAKTMDEIIVLKYKLKKFVAEWYDRKTGKFSFAQHNTFLQKLSNQINYVTNRWIISLHL